MKRMVVGLDGSDRSDRALRWTVALAAATGAHVTAATSFQQRMSEVPARRWSEETDALTDAFETDWCAPLRHAGIDYEPVVLERYPAPDHAFLDLVDRIDPDLVVVGSRGRGAVGSALLGSFADRVAHHTRRPLAVVPEQVPPTSPSRLLVGLDESAGSRAAAEWSAALATDLDIPVSAVHITVLAVGSVPEGDPRNPLRMLEGTWATPLTDRSVDVTHDVISSEHTANALLSAAHEAGAGAVVIGTRAAHPPLHPRLGGVTMRALHESTDLPIIVVPPVG
jgi:nucleotide-binding universal stress UspA family protein